MVTQLLKTLLQYIINLKIVLSFLKLFLDKKLLFSRLKYENCQKNYWVINTLNW